MRVRILACLLVTVAFSQFTNWSAQAESTLDGESTSQSYLVRAQAITAGNTGTDAGTIERHSVPASNHASSVKAPLTEAATVAAIEYILDIRSLNCFAPDDFGFQCLENGEDPDPENPADPTNEHSPAALTPAEFNTIIATQFAQLHVTGSGLDFQPNSGEGIIGIDFILATNPEAHLHHTQLFNIPLTIRATPVHYQWDMGDGNTISTTDPGKHYPDHTVTHLYEEPGTYTVTLTTTWTGHFTIEAAPNTTWYPIAGTITTTETSEPMVHKKYRTVLIPPEY